MQSASTTWCERKLRRQKFDEGGAIFDRLKSIAADADFVRAVCRPFGLPILANLRAGAWCTTPPALRPPPIQSRCRHRRYLPPDEWDGSCYFKSTDGHAGHWAFSRARLNWHVLAVAAEAGGVVLVDSTRRGRSLPDALAKTVPIWACVINRAVQAVAPEGSAAAGCPPPPTDRRGAPFRSAPLWRQGRVGRGAAHTPEGRFPVRAGADRGAAPSDG